MKLYGREVVCLIVRSHLVGLKVVRRFCFGDGYHPIPYSKSPPWRMLSFSRSYNRKRTQQCIGFVDVSKIDERMEKYV